MDRLVHMAAQIQEPLQTGTSFITVLTFMFPGTGALFQLLDAKFKPVQLQNSNVLTNDAFNGCRKQETSMSAGSRGTGEDNAHHSTSNPQPLTPQRAPRLHTTSATTAAYALTTQHALRGLFDHMDTIRTTGSVHALQNTTPPVPCRSAGAREAS